MKTKKLISITALILLISMAYGSYNISLTEFKLSDANYSHLGGLNWSRNIAQSFDLAKQENKPIEFISGQYGANIVQNSSLIRLEIHK